jgi:hypothetical protein
MQTIAQPMPPSTQGAPPPPAFDMSAFESKLAELQTVMVDLNGDGRPDVEMPTSQAQNLGRGATITGPGAGASEQRPPQMSSAGPALSAPPAGGMGGGPAGGAPGDIDTRPLVDEARDRISRGEPREAVIQDLFSRFTSAKAPPRGRPKFNAAQPVDGGMISSQPPEQMPQMGGMPGAPQDMSEGEEPDDYAANYQQFRNARGMANDEMAGRQAMLEAPAQAEGDDTPWGQSLASDVGKLGSKAMSYLPDVEMPQPRMPTMDDAGAALQGLGDMAMAAQATGGPPGAILGGIGNVIRNAPAVGNAVKNRLFEAGRSVTPEGRQINDARNRLTESFKASEALAQQTGKPPVFSPYQFRRDVVSPDGPTLPASIETGYADRMSRTVGKAAADHLTQGPKALPPPTPGQPNRLIAPEAQPIPPPRAYEQAGGARMAEQAAQDAQDVNRGTAFGPRQTAADDGIDGFMQVLAGLPRENTKDIPRLVKSFSEQEGVGLREVVAALERRGYRIDADSVPQHAFQTRQAGGRWGKLDPEWRELLGIIRERAGRR